ncbi:MAG: universal stress protein [Planctomycetaceae bacterium]
MIQLKRILVPTDFSKFSDVALRYASEFSIRFNSELHLLNVVQNPAYLSPDPTLVTGAVQEFGEQLTHYAQRQLDAVEPPFKPSKLTRSVREGAPVVEIVRYAKENDIDLIVLGTHGRTGLSHVFLGSVAENVVRKAPCPVLTVRHPEHDFVMP